MPRTVIAKLTIELCAHCGQPACGYARLAGNERVCHDDSEFAVDCYRLVTVYGEKLGSRIIENQLKVRWFARENDLIGGWCVMPADQPPSEGTPEVADFIRQDVAEHIAELHNAWLDGQPDESAVP
jgi:hypothetical protein